jgi:ABC-type sulfate transport system substrate-binding protein
VQVIVPNPKTSGNGRYTYLSAWGYVLKNGGDEEKAKPSSASCSSRHRCSTPVAAPRPPPS